MGGGNRSEVEKGGKGEQENCEGWGKKEVEESMEEKYEGRGGGKECEGRWKEMR